MCSWHDCIISCQHTGIIHLHENTHALVAQATEWTVRGLTSRKYEYARKTSTNELTGCPERLECYPGRH